MSVEIPNEISGSILQLPDTVVVSTTPENKSNYKQFQTIITKLNDLISAYSSAVDTINELIQATSDINDIVEDHEERIKALEDA